MARSQGNPEAYLSNREYPTPVLLKRFMPYYKKHLPVLAADLFCAALTTLCDIVLPMIIRFLTNTGIKDLASLSVSLVCRLALLYFVLRS